MNETKASGNRIGKMEKTMLEQLDYLGSPYSHPDPAIRQKRFEAVCRAAAELIRQGRTIYAPIVHSHPLCQYGLPVDWAFWERYDLAFLQRCDAVFVLMLDGWQDSVGVQAEIEAARKLGKPITFLDADIQIPAE